MVDLTQCPSLRTVTPRTPIYDWDTIKHVLPSHEATGARKRRDRRGNSSEESKRSGRSGTTLNDDTSFAFYQLGALHYCPRVSNAMSDDNKQIFAKKWYESDYVVVAEVTEAGFLGAV